MAETPAVAEQLHLPLQSGSDPILAAMHRGYNAARFLAKLTMARAVIDDLSVSTDIIVGFPSETERDFERTLEVVGEARFDGAFMFQFSPRPGTPAAGMADQIPAGVVQERFDRLVAAQNRITFERNQEEVGSRREVLVEGPSRKDPSVATTRTRGNKILHIPGSWDPGTFLQVRVTRAAPHHLEGELAL
jgi:tRNA-2-methylthio-N6-dimethylallyladenosine synthase